MVEEHSIVIYKAELSESAATKDDLLGLRNLSTLSQTNSGVYNIETITKIMDGFKPLRVVVYGNGMHASTIIRLIYTLQLRKYRLHIHRVIVNFDKASRLTTMILRFWQSL